jgi:hypothetical protein
MSDDEARLAPVVKLMPSIGLDHAIEETKEALLSAPLDRVVSALERTAEKIASA